MRKSQSLCIPFLFTGLFGGEVKTQSSSFIRSADNRIQLSADSTAFQRFFSRLDTLVRFGKGQVNVVHIGGSHVQADMYSHRIRQRMRALFPGFEGARGFVFPYRVAGTNNPANYAVQFGGLWTACRNVSAQYCRLGLSGMSVTTKDTTAWVRIIPLGDSLRPFRFTRVRLFHPTDSIYMQVEVWPPSHVEEAWTHPLLGFTEYRIREPLDTLTFYVRPGPQCGHSFTLFGVQFLNDDPGVIWHSVGVNGAATSSFLRCEYFVPHLKALQPDLVVLSLGVNDAYGPAFSAERFRENYSELVHWVKKAAPKAALLFITNNDTYMRRRYPNSHHVVARQVVLELAAEVGGGVWDLYNLMGGMGSIRAWHRAGLAQSDLIHFTRAGYELIGDRLFEALVDLWGAFTH